MSIQSHCNSFFKKNDFPHLCEIMYQATNQTLFSSLSLGLVKKGVANSEALITCPPLMYSIPSDKADKFIEDFFKKIYNLSIHEWKPAELESYQPLATSKVQQIAKQLGFEESVSISPGNVERCAKFGELPLVLSGITACKPFYRDLIGLNGLGLQQEAEGIIAHEIGHKAEVVDFKFFKDFSSFRKLNEIGADLYTLRNERLARGNLNALKRVQKLVPLEIEVPLMGENPFHPYFFERIQYLTEGLCGIYPEQNRDIC